MELTQEEKQELAVRSLTDCCAAMAERAGEVLRFGAYDAWRVPDCFWYDRVRLYGGAADVGETAREIADGVCRGALPPLLCWSDRDFSGAEIAPALEDAGFAPMVTQTTMYLPLSGRAPAPVPPQLEDMPPDALEDWALQNGRAFGKPPDTGALRLLLTDRNASFLQWREENEIVAGTLLFCTNGNGGLHEVFTLPSFQRRGIAGALVGRAVDLAARSGCGCATLQASPQGRSVYLGLGFEDVGKLHTWLLK